ncbi:polysaccharide deacetylase family protein [Alteribacter aurantiacus]|uniref:polysaccharide deacetylase family protein n=1 Tax=Alteribacter aurantiacus TaxID=254410 RepID=UPI0004097EB8|nr:polysaccharide deacetylase family protein [Alteribacter aurantiacus]
MQMRLVIVAFLFIIMAIGFYFFSQDEQGLSIGFHDERSYTPAHHHTDRNVEINIDEIRRTYENETDPTEWGERVSGVKNRMLTSDSVIALTFDACGGPFGNGYDDSLITFLREHDIPATLFVNFRWIEENEEVFLELAGDPLFDIANHGTEHLPLSVAGKGAWGIEGTSSVDEVIDEVMINQEKIESLTGKTPTYFRSGTAYYDEKAVAIAEDLGLTVVNYDVLGDAGATFTADQVKEALLTSTEGSIPLLHMNQPSSGTAQGVKEAIPLLLAKGFSFVHLDEYELTE